MKFFLPSATACDFSFPPNRNSSFKIAKHHRLNLRIDGKCTQMSDSNETKEAEKHNMQINGVKMKC